jgi:hypothetical protein
VAEVAGFGQDSLGTLSSRYPIDRPAMHAADLIVHGSSTHIMENSVSVPQTHVGCLDCIAMGREYHVGHEPAGK